MSDPPNEIPCLFNEVCSMIPSTKHQSINIKFQQVKTERGVNGEGDGEREREREQRINRVRDGALDRFGNSMGWKWPLLQKVT